MITKPHIDPNRPFRIMLDSDLIGLPPAFAARVFLHRRGWMTHQASIGQGRTSVAIAERGDQRIRCEGTGPTLAWEQVLKTAFPGSLDRISH